VFQSPQPSVTTSGTVMAWPATLRCATNVVLVVPGGNVTVSTVPVPLVEPAVTVVLDGTLMRSCVSALPLPLELIVAVIWFGADAATDTATRGRGEHTTAPLVGVTVGVTADCETYVRKAKSVTVPFGKKLFPELVEMSAWPPA
jgi:hypothetical protein